ncbi:mitochondrial ribonuclease P protein 1 homolog [Helicoverpa zea]|uniref:mitochondrial ribonuclease P protein 1 homolog n=1 Tax=Helicoverpa zea TaxID=7113 RepID=UPI001F55EC70|nr:mitochondrial ribonuclease P protein 1 homolog [Helicoverpa zea]XP_047027258.1 mitochondrial ribonuclease P protein 1 homolog [Helicoverpa zea]
MYCIRTAISLVCKNRNKIVPPPVTYKIKQFTTGPIYFSSSQIDDTDLIVHNICKGDAELEKKLRILMLEVEVMRQDGRHAPDNIKQDQWQHLLELTSKNQRASYLQYLFKTEKSRENFKAKKEAKRKENPVIKPEESKENEDDLLYGIQHQSLFLRIRDQSINQFDNYRALQSLMHGQSIVIDCSYEDNMVYKETLNAAKQLTYVFGDNRVHKEPFNLHICNVNMGGKFMKQMMKNIPSLDEPWFPLNIHTKSYLDVFPKEKLVYLTPHCREELTKFDHDAVYIIGCMVDKVNNEPLSLAKAKRDGIKMAKLPLDRYLEWAPGSKKNLNINHMVPILLDLKLTGDWEYSLRHVPRRKLMETKIMAMQKRLSHNPSLKEEVMKNFKLSRLNTLAFKEKRKFNQSKSKRSLYDDENI